jgi:hypothetical protein
MPPVETMEVDSPVTEVEVEITKKDVKDVDTTTTEGMGQTCPQTDKISLNFFSIKISAM